MSEAGNKYESSGLNIEIINCLQILDNEFITLTGETEASRMEKDARIKTRVLNLVSVFKHYYKLPEIIEVYKDTRAQERRKLREESGDEKKPPVYFLTETSMFVTGDYTHGVLGIIKPKINNQHEMNMDGQWGSYGTLLKNELLQRAVGPKKWLEIALGPKA
jgi:hypothetical protein